MNGEAALSLGEVQPASKWLCSHPGCERKRRSGGSLCATHTYRKQHGVDMDAPPYGYTPWGQLVDRALALADSHGTDEWSRQLEKFKDAAVRVAACGLDEVQHGWRKKRIVLRMVRTRGRCTVEGCNRVHRAKGLCERHYQRARAAERRGES